MYNHITLTTKKDKEDENTLSCSL